MLLNTKLIITYALYILLVQVQKYLNGTQNILFIAFLACVIFLLRRYASIPTHSRHFHSYNTFFKTVSRVESKYLSNGERSSISANSNQGELGRMENTKGIQYSFIILFHVRIHFVSMNIHNSQFTSGEFHIFKLKY